MPPKPWKTFREVQPDGDCHLVITKLEAGTWRSLPTFLRHSLRSVRQLRPAGALGYSLLADPRRLTFWTLTAWESPVDIRRYVATPPHRAAMRWARERPKGSKVFESATWTAPGSAIPAAWDDALRHLEACAT